MSLFYFLAGLNHFLNPNFYVKLIPSFFPKPELLNDISGTIEIVLSILILFSRTRKIGAWGIILMLIAFIPVHIQFLWIGTCVDKETCLPLFAWWFRLIVIHPVLIYWAYSIQVNKKV
jgi:uncharacterized membrane protein